MKKTLLMTGALLCLGAGLASAQINLNWQDCIPAADAPNRAFACNSNNGNNALISTFVPPAALVAVTGGDLVMDMQSADAVLPPWWDFGGCRPATALLFGTDFSGTSGTCNDIFGPALGGGFNFSGFGGPNRERFKHGFALAAGFPSVGAGTETYFSRIVIFNTGTVGGCARCQAGACIVLNQINLTQDPTVNGAQDYHWTAPATHSHVTWQGNVSGAQCPGSTPARTSTWGMIKTLYR